MLIRPYAATDRESVAGLDVETAVRSVAVLGLARGRLTWREARLERVGFATSSLTGWNSRLVLRHMYVDGAARRQGVGTALLQAVLAGERARDAQHVWLETQADNVPAIRAYERMGFRVVGLDQTLYGDRPGTDTAVFMSQPLSRGHFH